MFNSKQQLNKMNLENLNTLKSILTPAGVVRDQCQKSREQIAQDAHNLVSSFVNSKLEPTLKYIDNMVRASADLSPNSDYILLTHDAVFKNWGVSEVPDEQLLNACNEMQDFTGNSKHLLKTQVTKDNFKVRMVTTVLNSLEPVLKAQGYRLQLCHRFGHSTEYDCFDIIWGWSNQ